MNTGLWTEQCFILLEIILSTYHYYRLYILMNTLSYYNVNKYIYVHHYISYIYIYLYTHHISYIYIHHIYIYIYIYIYTSLYIICIIYIYTSYIYTHHIYIYTYTSLIIYHMNTAPGRWLRSASSSPWWTAWTASCWRWAWSVRPQGDPVVVASSEKATRNGMWVWVNTYRYHF